MLTVGLTGGLATGKSFVSRELARLGAHVIQADALGHEVLAPEGDAYGPVVSRFGAGILDPNGTINRARLASLVFTDAGLLAELNALVHPAVRRLEREYIENARREDPGGVVVVEAAILIETGFYKDYDRIVLVTCDEASQRERALSRPGATVEDVQSRLSRQLPLAEKLHYAHDLIDTSGTKECTLRQTGEVYERLRALARGHTDGSKLAKMES